MQRANVDPYRGHRRTQFTVSVRVPEPAIRSGAVQRTYEVEATGPTWKHGCVSSDSVPVDSASANELVKVTLSPPAPVVPRLVRRPGARDDHTGVPAGPDVPDVRRAGAGDDRRVPLPRPRVEPAVATSIELAMDYELPDGTELPLPDGATGADAAAAIGPGLARAALAVKVDGEVRDLARPLPDRGRRQRRGQDRDPHRAQRGGGARRDPPRRRARARRGDARAVPGGQDLDRAADRERLLLRLRLPGRASRSATPTSSGSSRRCASTSTPTSRSSARTCPSRRRARGSRDEHQDYKVELIDDLVRNADPAHPVETVSLYTNGPFTDLCRGPHAPSTKRIKAFKLQSVAGAYWRGDAEAQDAHARVWDGVLLEQGARGVSSSASSAPAPTTIAGSARSSACSASPTSPPGSAFWLPAGTEVFNELVALSREMGRPRGYTEVKTPQLYDSSLWETSGHWGKYRENMFVTEVRGPADGGQADELPRPLPAVLARAVTPTATCRVRYSEPGLLHRNEPSGTLHGLLRVRHFAQDDGHIFCTEDQIQQEVADCLEFAFATYEVFGIDVRLELSTRPENRIGSDELWDLSESGAPGRARDPQPRVRAQPGRRRLLRAEDRHAHDRLARALVAARHGAARLQHAPALRPDLHRGRQRRAHAGDDPPGADGLLRAVHRDPARALRGRAPRCGWRRCRRSCCRSPTATTTTPQSVRERLRGAGLRVELDDRQESVGARSATPSCARFRTCSSSAIASRRRAGRAARAQAPATRDR